jgi:hypothetical protein
MKFYHVSTRKIKRGMPKKPKSSLAEHGYEDNTTKRFSVAPSIKKALMAKAMPLHDTQLYVYEVVPSKKTRSITNRMLVKNKLVPDAHLTGERWILDPVRVKLVGKIQVTEPYGRGKSYTYSKKKKAKLYNWRYKFLNKVKK